MDWLLLRAFEELAICDRVLL